jgi:transposase
MALPVLGDELWKRIERLLPPLPDRHKQYAGRRPISDRQALIGILFVLDTGIAWNKLPRELGCGSGVSCWRRLKSWQGAGVWVALCRILEGEAHAQLRAALSRAGAGIYAFVPRGPKKPHRNRRVKASPKKWRRRMSMRKSV